jgi:hypothetical protein
MELAHDQIVEYLRKYFTAYSTVAQDPRTTHQMNDYYAPDLTVTVYTPRVSVSNRETMLRRSSSHPDIQETLIPEHIMVDERQHMATVLLRGEFTFKATGEVLTHMFSAHYQFVLDEKERVKIKNLWLFAQLVRSGKQSIFEIYEEAFRRLKQPG